MAQLSRVLNAAYPLPRQVSKAVKALVAYHNKKHGVSSKLIEDDDYISLQFALNYVPNRNERKTSRLYVGEASSFCSLFPPSFSNAPSARRQIPHSFMNEDAQVCLFVKDPQREYKDLVKAKNITCVHRIVGMEKLKTKFKQFENRRILCGEYDMFLADDRIVHLLPQYLGKTFFDKKKYGSRFQGCKC